MAYEFIIISLLNFSVLPNSCPFTTQCWGTRYPRDIILYYIQQFCVYMKGLVVTKENIFNFISERCFSLLQILYVIQTPLEFPSQSIYTTSAGRLFHVETHLALKKSTPRLRSAQQIRWLIWQKTQSQISMHLDLWYIRLENSVSYIFQSKLSSL